MKSRTGVARYTRALLTVVVAAVGAATIAPVQAQAVDPGTIISIVGFVKDAYDAYQDLNKQHVTLDEANAQILQAINTSRTAILTEIDALAAANIKSCAKAAVIDFADINLMTVDQLQQFASDSTNCVTDAWALIPPTSELAAVDEIGFALNIVGPIALAARSTAYGPTDAGTLQLRDTIIQANQSNLVRLYPQCGGVRGEVVNGVQEVALICTEYNGDTGDAGTIFIDAGAPIPTGLDYSSAIPSAVARTSYPVSVGALDGLLDDPTVTSPGDQIGYFNSTASLQLTASGAAAPYTWKVTGLPPGLTSNPAGLITGTFTQVGTFTARAMATDTQAQFATVTFTWTVAPPLTVGHVNDRNALIGAAQSLTLTATGGTQPYTWSVTGLPSGIVATTTGVISGTPTVAGVFHVSYTATDQRGITATGTFTWTITHPPVTVPKIVGDTLAQASSALSAVGLAIFSQTNISTINCDLVGTISSQNPAAGTVVNYGSSVTFTMWVLKAGTSCE